MATMTRTQGLPPPGGGRLSIRDVSLFVDVVGHGYPLVLMHGGPGADHWSLAAFGNAVTGSPWSSTITAATGARPARRCRR